MGSELEPGWLARQFAKNQDEVDLWPGWMRKEAAHRALRERRPAPTYRYPPPEERIPQLEAALAAAEAARDRAQAGMEEYARRNLENLTRRLEAEQCVTRLAALEQAARVWREDQTIEAEAVLCDAIADLDALPGEGA